MLLCTIRLNAKCPSCYTHTLHTQYKISSGVRKLLLFFASFLREIFSCLHRKGHKIFLRECALMNNRKCNFSLSSSRCECVRRRKRARDNKKIAALVRMNCIKSVLREREVLRAPHEVGDFLKIYNCKCVRGSVVARWRG
jgi:hypothetical protein